MLVGSVLNCVERLAAFLQRTLVHIVVNYTLLHLREGALVNTFYELGLLCYFRVLMKDFFVGEEVLFAATAPVLRVNDLARGVVVVGVVDGERVGSLSMVDGLVQRALLIHM